MFDYILQDARARYSRNGFFTNALRYFRLPSFKLLVNYRLTQYILKSRFAILGRDIWLILSRLRLERINSKCCTTLNEDVEAGAGLSFPHHGPFVISSGAKIGKYCTIHPQVLVGGDRGKGAPVIGDYVFIGNGAKIIGNCKIGDWVFISPGAFITKDIPSGSLVGYGLNNIINDDGKRHVEMYLK